MCELGPFDKRCVNVQCRHVVHENGDTKALAIGEDILEQSGLAGTEESRNQSNRDRSDDTTHRGARLLANASGAASGAFLRIYHLGVSLVARGLACRSTLLKTPGAFRSIDCSDEDCYEIVASITSAASAGGARRQLPDERYDWYYLQWAFGGGGACDQCD